MAKNIFEITFSTVSSFPTLSSPISKPAIIFVQVLRSIRVHSDNNGFQKHCLYEYKTFDQENHMPQALDSIPPCELPLFILLPRPWIPYRRASYPSSYYSRGSQVLISSQRSNTVFFRISCNRPSPSLCDHLHKNQFESVLSQTLYFSTILCNRPSPLCDRLHEIQLSAKCYICNLSYSNHFLCLFFWNLILSFS